MIYMRMLKREWLEACTLHQNRHRTTYHIGCSPSMCVCVCVCSFRFAHWEMSTWQQFTLSSRFLNSSRCFAQPYNTQHLIFVELVTIVSKPIWLCSLVSVVVPHTFCMGLSIVFPPLIGSLIFIYMPVEKFRQFCCWCTWQTVSYTKYYAKYYLHE